MDEESIAPALSNLLRGVGQEGVKAQDRSEVLGSDEKEHGYFETLCCSAHPLTTKWIKRPWVLLYAFPHVNNSRVLSYVHRLFDLTRKWASSIAD